MTGREHRRLQRLLWLSAVALFFERLWPRLWPLAAVAGAFVALALLDVLPRLPAVWHAGVLAAFALALLAAGYYALPALRPVDRRTAMRRLDRNAKRGHRPLAASEDSLAHGASDPLSEALWERHRQQMAAAAARLRVRWPAPDMARHEPWGIRAFVVLLLVIGLAAGSRDWQPRLVGALTPDIFGLGTPVSVDLWITPPPYTHRPPVFLRAGTGQSPAGESVAPQSVAPQSGAAVQVPAGSSVQGRVTGTGSAPRLRLGEATVPFTALAAEAETPASFRAEAMIETGDRISVRSAHRELAGWPMQVIADAPPTVSFLDAPAAKGNGLLGLAYQATDDYGISDISAIIRPQAGGGELRIPLALTVPKAPLISGHDLQDLAAHPWAGQPVLIQLEARDAIGGTDLSPAVAMTLPERTFSHPVAKAIIAERARLKSDDEAVRRGVAVTLDRIAALPEAYANEVVVTLGLVVARARLLLDRTGAQVDSVQTLLWNLALHLEEGGVPAAERRLQAAREQLMETLRRDAPAEEIARLMETLKDALDEYLAAAAAEVARREPEAMPTTPLGEMLSSDDLHTLLDQAAELSRTGSREAAQALLGELQRVLDGIRLGLQQGPESKRLARAAKTIEDLRALKAEQQALLDRTYQRLREQMAARRAGRRDSSGGGDADLQRQKGLRQQLGQLAERLQDDVGDIPEALGGADAGMRDAIGAMAGNRLEPAVDGQSRAVDALGRAADQAGQSLAQQLGSGAGLFGLTPGNPGGGDPFGRTGANGRRGLATGTVKIPEQSETQRVKELLQELRRRAGERERSGDELRYIERLLRQF